MLGNHEVSQGRASKKTELRAEFLRNRRVQSRDFAVDSSLQLSRQRLAFDYSFSEATGGRSSDQSLGQSKDLLLGQSLGQSSGQSLGQSSGQSSGQSYSRVLKCVALYVALPSEPQTKWLIDAYHRAGVQVILPVLGGGDPAWGSFESWDQLVPGYRGILGPASADAGIETADLIWIAGLAATRTGVRLGKGGGWYDRTLVHRRPGATVGVLLNDCEIVPQLPSDPWDQPVDLIVTESRIIKCVDRDN